MISKCIKKYYQKSQSQKLACKFKEDKDDNKRKEKIKKKEKVGTKLLMYHKFSFYL